VTDLSDPKSVHQRNVGVRLDAKARREMILAIMSLPQGREWVWSVLEICHPFANPFRADALEMAFLSGEMNIGQRIIAEIQAATPDLYMQMCQEAGEKDGRARERDTGANGDATIDEYTRTGNHTRDDSVYGAAYV
jgi:hypothetical protein